MEPDKQAPFESFRDLRAAHSRLLKARAERGPAALGPAAEEVSLFLARARATGRKLDAPPEREAAQSAIDYWTATLYALPGGAAAAAAPPDGAGGTPDAHSLLEPFDAATVRRVADDAEAWFSALPPDRQENARRALTRMVVLPADGKAFAPCPVSRAALDSYGPPERVDAGLAKLEQMKVLRITPGETPGAALVALRYDALVREWPRMAGWLDRRLRFREASLYWQANGRAPAALIRDELLDEAREYHDRDDLEKQFLDASAKRAQYQDQRELKRTRWITGLAVVAALAGVAAGFAAWKFSLERAAKDDARIRAESLRKKGVEALALAESGSTLVLIDLLTGNDAHLAKKLLIIQTLGQMVSATSDAAWKAARANWVAFEADLKRDAAKNHWFANEFFPGQAEEGVGTTNAERIHLLMPSRAESRKHRQELYWVSKFLGRYLEGATRADPEVKDRWYGVVRLTVASLAGAAEQGRTFEEVVAFEGLFWRLYLGEMILVEGRPVEELMVRFGGHLAEWEKLGPAAEAPRELANRMRATAEELKAACDLESKPVPADD